MLTSRGQGFQSFTLSFLLEARPPKTLKATAQYGKVSAHELLAAHMVACIVAIIG